jgi:hypothetical protein
MTELALGGSLRAACTLIGSDSVQWELVGPGHKDNFHLTIDAADQLLDDAVDGFGRWDGRSYKVWVADDVANWLTRDHRAIAEADGADSPASDS